MSPANTEFEGNKKNPANFSIQGKIKEAETGRGVSGLTIEAVDKDGTCDDRLGSTITDDKGYFELTYGHDRSGKGSDYYMGMLDSNGNVLDGSKTYKLHIPPNPPAKDFWAITLYDTQTLTRY